MMAKRGPKTEAGKDAVRLNAAKHAILSFSPVIPGMETEDDWLTHRDGVIESLHPDGYLEVTLAERVALNLWRLKRVARFESETVAINLDRIEENLALPSRLRYKDSLEAFLQSRRLISMAGLEKAVEFDLKLEDLLRTFTEHPDNTRIEQTTALSVLQFMSDYFNVDQIEGEKVVEALHHLRDGITVGDVWSTLCRLCDEETEVMRAIFHERLSDMEDARMRKKESESALVRERERARSLSLLPDEATLGKIQRYEAHLHRQFLQTLHELEAFQSRSRGEPAPLVRVDMQGASTLVSVIELPGGAAPFRVEAVLASRVHGRR